MPYVNSTSCDSAFANIFYEAKAYSKKPDLQTINAWNHDYNSQAYLDDKGDPHLVSTYNFVGGFTSTNFLDWIQTYYNELADFDSSLNGK